MSEAEEKNDNRADGEEAIPTASFGGSSVGPGGEIGPYKLLSVLGEGGYGIVYLAERLRPVKRRVALKVIKPGMDTKQVIARFEAERQALALLEHPNIAHVFNAGTTEAGRPYFVMEYVKGVPITEHCDRHKLTIEERLNLFLRVCEAVQHAHQKGIIHRDIKPSNIQVSVEGEKAVPKVIDFGVAKAISQSLTERTLVTEQGQFVGTPEYMSPEQAEMTGQDVDTRTDIYSLGVVFYQLLTGVLPFEAKTLREGGVDHIRQVIREEDPKTPSTRLSTISDEESMEVARSRCTDIRTLGRKLHGDLDWITLKAMEKDRTRRYQTAHALGEDIQRHLTHEPVLAGPPSKIYRLKKLLRKYRTQAIAAATMAILLAGMAVISVMYLRAVNRGKEAKSLKHKDILSKAMELRSSGQFQEALTKVEAIVDSEHVGPKAHLLRGRLVLELQGPAAAVKELQKLLNERDEIACQAHFLLARIYLESDPGDPETTEEYQQKAKEHQQKGEKLFSESAEAYFNRSMMAGTVDKTLEWLNKAIDFEPGHYDSREARALAYYALRDYRNMERDAVAIITLKGWDSLGYSLMAIALRETENFADAVKYHNKAIKISPAEAELYNERRRTHMQMGNYEKVLSDAQECVRLKPDVKIYHFHTFCALAASGRYDEAKVKYDTIIESGLMSKGRFRLSAAKYVSDTLDAGLLWYPPESKPEGAAFLAMHEAGEIYEQLAKKAKRVVAEGFHANWSPDGTELGYSRGVLGSSGIEILNRKTGKTRLLTTPGKDPEWSPDGKYVVYVRDRQILPLGRLTAEYEGKHGPILQEEVWLIKSDGTEAPRFLARGGWACWSGDSKRVFYHSRVDMMLCSISIEDGAKPTPIIQCPSYFPVVSPDEKYVAYRQGRELRIVEISSGSVIARWLVPLEIQTLLLNFSPSGRELGIGGFGTLGFWIYDLKTKKPSKLLSGSFGWCSWSPTDDKRQIAIGKPYGALHHEIWVADLDPNVSTAEALGPGRTVEEHYQELANRFSRRIDIDPEDEGNYLSLDRLLRNLGLLGMEHYRSGAYEEALVTLRRVDKLRRTVLNKESRPPEVAFIATALHELGREQEAQAAVEQLRRLFEDGKHTGEESYLREAEQLLAGKDSKVYLVWECIEAGKLKEASQLVEELRSLPPEEYAEIAGGVQSAIKALARAYCNRGKSTEGRGKYTKTIGDYEAAVRIDPGCAPAFNELAWLCATCPVAEFRDGAKAIENATKACKLTNWKDYGYVATLAAAYAEAGDFDAAVKWQKKSFDLLGEDERPKWQRNYESRLKLYQSGKPYHRSKVAPMVGWWKFDGDATDSSGYGRDGNEIGNPTYAPGISGQALALRGDGDHVLIPSAGARLNASQALTVCLWVKSNVTGTDKGFIIFEDPVDSPAGGVDNRDMRYDAAGVMGGGKNIIKVAITSADGRQQLESSGDVQTTEWQHLAMTWSSGNTVKLYVNGVEDSPTWAEAAKAGSLVGCTKLIIGKGGKDIGVNKSWNGLIDDVRIYSYALSEDEIKALYAGKEPRTK